MGELVEQDRDEEQDRRGERRGPDQAASPIRMPGGKYAGTEARGDQKEDDKQAPVDKDINAGNAAYSKSYVHRRSFPRSLGLIHWNTSIISPPYRPRHFHAAHATEALNPPDSPVQKILSDP